MKRIKTAILIVLLIACAIVFVACNKTTRNEKSTNITLTAINGDVENIVINTNENAVSCTVDNSVDSFDLSQLVFSTTDGIDVAVFADAELTQSVAKMELAVGENAFFIKVSGDKEIVYKLTITRKEAPHVHTFSDKWSYNDTEHWHEATCEHTSETVDKSLHTWDNGTETIPATEESEGIKTFICTVCGASKTEPIAKLTHTHTISTDWSSDAFYHWHTASCGRVEHNTDKAAHTWDSGIITTPATEESEGVKTYLCTICGATKTESVDKLAHTHTISTDWSSDAFYHWHAASCGKTEHNTSKAAHTWDSGVVTTPATEESEGTMSYLCTVCGYTKTELIAKLTHVHTYETEWTIDENYHWHVATCGHDVIKDKAVHAWGNGSIIKEATEEETGIMFFVCLICGKTKEVVTPQLEHTHKFSEDWTSDENYHWHIAVCEHSDQISGKSAHIWDSGIVTDPATEENAGIMTYSCTVCGKEKTEIIAQLPHTHTYETDWSSDETYHWHAANCEHTSLFKDKDMHAWNDGVITKEPTETAEGIRMYTCLICNNTKNEAIPKLPHNHTFDLEHWVSDSDNHWHPATCEHTDEVFALAEHDWVDDSIVVEATETIEGQKQQRCSVCDKIRIVSIGFAEHIHTFDLSAWTFDGEYHWHAATCGHTSETKDRAQHIWDTGVVISSATEQLGEQTKYTCTICGRTKTETTSAPLPHTHKFDTTQWEYDSLYHWNPAICEHTNEKGNKAEHTWGEWVETIEATEDTFGEQTRICTICGKTQSQELPKLPHTFSDEWSYDETHHWHAATCAHINEKSGESPHNWGTPIITQEPTLTSEGVLSYTCTVCAYTKNESIEPLTAFVLPFWAYGFDEDTNEWQWSNIYTLYLVSKDTGYDVYIQESEEEYELISGGAIVTAYAPEDMEGYRFLGWEYDGEIVSSTNAEGDIFFSENAINTLIGSLQNNEECILSANYAQQITIDFKTQDGEVFNTQIIDKGTKPLIPTPPTRNGYRTNGWDIDPNNIFNEDIIITALYVEQFTVLFVDYDGTLLKECIVDKNTDATPPAEPTREGYTFVSWSNQYIFVTKNTTSMAIYSLNSYTISFKMPGGTTAIPLINSEGATINDQVYWGASVATSQIPNIPTAYIANWNSTDTNGIQVKAFTGWKANGNIVNIFDYAVYEDTVFEAYYESPYDTPVVAVDFSTDKVFIWIPSGQELFALNFCIDYSVSSGVNGSIKLKQADTPHNTFEDGKSVNNAKMHEFSYTWTKSEHDELQSNTTEGIFFTLFENIRFQYDSGANQDYISISLDKTTIIINSIEDGMNAITPIVIYRGRN